MKIRERKLVSQGIGGGYWAARVIEIEDDAPVPAGAVQVADETPVSDWARDKNQAGQSGQEG